MILLTSEYKSSFPAVRVLCALPPAFCLILSPTRVPPYLSVLATPAPLPHPSWICLRAFALAGSAGGSLSPDICSLIPTTL